MVLEGMPWRLAERITKSLAIPTIGIGAGPHCDGQVLVINDMLGLLEEFSPKFVKRYGEFGKEITKAVAEYVDDVKKGKFPGSEHSY
jgi:3-methyl-2-oxobutanoate hydroxymethyltransferase